jgi:NAD(P)H-dependent FMN reductase
VLTERGATVSFCSTVDMPLVPSGMDDVVGFSYPKEITDVAEVVRSADAVVLGVPVQQSAVSGVARNWVELFRSEIEGKPVLPVVAAGSDRSHLAAVQFQAELFTHFGAAPVKPVVVTSATPLAEILDRLVDATDDLLVHFPAERARIKSAS